MHSNWVCSFAEDPNLLHLYSIAHDKTIIQWNVKKLEKMRKFTGFKTKGFHRSFSVSELTHKIYGIDAISPNSIKILEMNRNKVELLHGSKAPILSLIKASMKPVLYCLYKDNKILIWNLNSKIILKSLINIHPFDISVIALSSRGHLFAGSSDDKLKIIYEDSIVRTFDVMNFESSIDCIQVSPNSKYIFVGGDNQVIHIIKDIRMIIKGSSGSGSFESLRTLSSNEMERRSRVAVNLSNVNEGIQSVIFGKGNKKRKTLNPVIKRKSSFWNKKKLLSKGSLELRYQVLKSDSFGLQPKKIKQDLIKLKPLMSIYEEGEKRKSSEEYNENHSRNILNLENNLKFQK